METLLRILLGKFWVLYNTMLLHQDQVFTKQGDLQRQEDLKIKMQKEVKILQNELDVKKDWPQDVFHQKKKDIEKIESRIKKNIDPNMLTICAEINNHNSMVVWLRRYAMRELIRAKRFWIYTFLIFFLIAYFTFK